MILTDSNAGAGMEAYATCTSDECQTDTSGEPTVDGDCEDQ